MDRNLSLSLIIGATVAGTMAAAVGQTVTQMGRVGEATKRAQSESQDAISRTAKAQQQMGQIDTYRRAGQAALAAGRDYRAASDQVGLTARQVEETRATLAQQTQALQQVRGAQSAAAVQAKATGDAERNLAAAHSRVTAEVQAGDSALRAAAAARQGAQAQADALTERERLLAGAMAATGPATAQQVAAAERARAATERAVATLERRQAAERRVADAVAAGRIPQDQARAAMQAATDATQKAAEALAQKRTAEQSAAAAVAAGAPSSRAQQRELDQTRAALARATEALEKKRAAEQQAAATLAQSRQRLTEQTAALDRAGVEAREAASALATLKAQESALASAVSTSTARHREQATALEQARAATARAAAEAERTRQRVVELRNGLQAAGVDTANLARHQRTLAGDLERAARQADRAQAEIEQLGEAAERAGKRMEIGATLQRQAIKIGATAAAFSAATKPAIAFESAMADVRKVVDFDSPQEFRQMGDDILNLSRRIPLAATGLADITAAAGQAGIARKELLRFTEDAAKMGVAFDLTGKEAGAAMTGLRTIFGLTQDGVTGLGDAINHISNNMDARAADILNIENRVGSMGKMFGLTGQQVAALGASFLALKTPPEVAATGINALLGKLATATTQPKEFQQALRGIGLDAADLKTAIGRDAQGALLTFLKAVEGADDKMTVLAELFGAEYADDMAKLVGSLGTYEKSLGLVGDKAKYAGSMQKEFETRAGTTGNGITLMNNSLFAASEKIGEALLPMLDMVGTLVAKAADAVAFLAGEMPWLVQTLTLGATAWTAIKTGATIASYASTFFAGGLPAVIARMVGMTAAATASGAANTVASAGLWAHARAATAASFGWARLGISMIAAQAPIVGGALASGVTSVGATLLSLARGAIPVAIGGLRALTVAVMTNPIGLIVGGIALAAGLLISNWDTVGPFFSGLWDGIKGAASQFWDTIKVVVSWTPLGIVMRAWEPVAGWIGALWDGITGKVGAAVDWMAGKLGWIKDAWRWVTGDDAANAKPGNDNSRTVGRTATGEERRGAQVGQTVGAPADAVPSQGGLSRPEPARKPAEVGQTVANAAPKVPTVAAPQAVQTRPVSGGVPPGVGQTVTTPTPQAVAGLPSQGGLPRPVSSPVPPVSEAAGRTKTRTPAPDTATAPAAPAATRIDHREEIHIHVHGVSDPRRVADMVITEIERRRRGALTDAA